MLSTGELQRGAVARSAFTDTGVFEAEVDRLWRRSWLFVAPSSVLAQPGSFVTTCMGLDPVIARRDRHGGVSVFINACPHDAGRLCSVDSGVTDTMTCPHGTTFDLDAPGCLRLAPHVAWVGDLLFACWSSSAPSLEEYLGDLQWWFETFVLLEALGGLEALPGCQRYVIPANWKLYCDNFSGDGYHVPTTHASAVKLGVAGGLRGQGAHGYFTASFPGGHGIGWFLTDRSQYERDLEAARPLGKAAVNFVRERQRVIQDALGSIQARPSGGWVFGLCFPNLTMQGMNSALRGHVAGVCHPRTVNGSEVWQWCLVERAAPEVVKERAALSVSRGQSAAGLIGADDSENFERITGAAFSPAGRRLTFHYGMDAAVEGDWPGAGDWDVRGLPGAIGPELSESAQRRFYQRWAELLAAE